MNLRTQWQLSAILRGKQHLVTSMQFERQVPKVAFVAGNYAPDLCGIADYTENLRHALRECGTESTVLTTSDSARLCRIPSVLDALTNWDLGGVISLVRTIEKVGANIVHVQYTRDSSSRFNHRSEILWLPAVVRCLGISVRIVTTVHENFGDTETAWNGQKPSRLPVSLVKSWGQQTNLLNLERATLLPGSDALLVTTALNESEGKSRLQLIADRIVRIPIGSNIPLQRLSRTEAACRLRKEQGWPIDSIIIASFGFLSVDRDLSLLIRAFRIVMATDSRVRLLIIGGVESMRLRGQKAKAECIKLSEVIADLGLAQYISVTGYLSREDVSLNLLGSDIGVTPFKAGTSLKSGSLIAMLSHHLPTIATRHNPPDPDLDASRSVVLVPPNDADALANSFKVLITLPPDSLAAMRDACASFSQQFDWSIIAKKHISVYDAVLNSSEYDPGLGERCYLPADHQDNGDYCI
jgi:glycosyltransferase involved in cell wall biosynthesis